MAPHAPPTEKDIVHGRRSVRPHLRPGSVAAKPHPRRHLAFTAAPAPIVEAFNGAPADVMLQGFHWTSRRSSAPSWYGIVEQNAPAIREAGFDLVWFPPPSQSAFGNEGYMPTRWNVLDSAYGSKAELTSAIAALAPLRPIADVVVNHRCGVASGQADFEAPPFPDQARAICRDDESGIGTGDLDTGESQPAARDLDHTNPDVRRLIKEYLSTLKAVGFQGWRYDEVRGYAGDFVREYNEDSRPHLSVGEFWDGDRQNVVNWIDSTRGRSMAFDFPTRAVLKAAIDGREFWRLKAVDGKPTGVIGWWPEMSVTFLEDHDTDKDHPFPDEFGDGDQILQGYAYLLTHPGIPCVYWTHYFDYGAALRSKIGELIGLRKATGLHRASSVDIVAADEAKYAAVVDDKVAVKLGPGAWDPGSGFAVAVDGNDFAVWTR